MTQIGVALLGYDRALGQRCWGYGTDWVGASRGTIEYWISVAGDMTQIELALLAVGPRLG